MTMEASDFRFVVGEEENPARLDKYLSAVLPDLSRSYCQKLIEAGQALVNGRKVKSHRQVHNGDVIVLHVPQTVALNVEAQDIPLEVLYEDSDILILNKRPGIVVHPSPGHLDGTLVNALLFHTRDLSSINGVLRPGIVHRLDKEASGCLVVAKNDRAHKGLADQFEGREIKKEYAAIVAGRMVQQSGIIEMKIGRHPTVRKKMAVRPEGREARTTYERLEEMGGCTLLKLTPTTGRTHQLRVHLAAMGFPILGDEQYGKRRHSSAMPLQIARQMLHAWTLAFRHPRSREIIRCAAPIPEDMEQVMEALRAYVR